MIRFERVSKRFGPVSALSDVDFEIAGGKLVGLLGPNGAGKTTCLRLIGGVLRPSSGRVVVGGVDVKSAPLRTKRALGYLPDGAPIYPELRASEYLAFRAHLKGIARRRRSAEIERVIALCALEDAKRRIVGQLSRGYRQRLGLADALLGDPSILVLDEPTVGLDPNQLRELRGLIRRLAGRRTVLLSTHLLSEAEAICEQVLIIDRGRLVASGRLDEVLAGAQDEIRVDVFGLPDNARRLVMACDGVASVEIVSAGDRQPVELRVAGRLDARGRARLVGRLVGAGCEVSACVPQTRGLERAFALMTGADEDDRALGRGRGRQSPSSSESESERPCTAEPERVD